MPLIDFLSGNNKLNGDSNGSAFFRMLDRVGNSMSRKNRENIPVTQDVLLMGGKNDQHATIFRTDRKGNQIFGNYIPELVEQFEGTTLNARKWGSLQTTFVQSLATLAGYNLNSTNLVTANAVLILQSNRLFYKVPRSPLQFKVRLKHSIFTNSIADFGFGIPATTTTMVANGCCFRVLTSGNIMGVITYNSVEIVIDNVKSNATGANLDLTAYANKFLVYDIIADDDNVIFTIQDTETNEIIGEANLSIPATATKMWGATSLPIYARLFNAAVAPSVAPVFVISELQVLSTDTNISPNCSEVAANLSWSQASNPYNGGQLANHTNSTAPTSATLSNTAGGYAATIKDGKFQFAAVAGAITDYALFGFQVPAGSRFLVEGVKIDLYNTVAAVATTATVFEWAIGLNSTAVSLASGSILRLPLGVQNLQVGAAIGAQCQTIDVDFKTGEIVESGRFVHLILTVPIGTATATEVFRGTYLLKGRFL